MKEEQQQNVEARALSSRLKIGFIEELNNLLPPHQGLEGGGVLEIHAGSLDVFADQLSFGTVFHKVHMQMVCIRCVSSCV